MTPELKRDFEAEWPALERRLKLVLCHKRVPLTHQEDLLQEVALRLVRTWTTIDKDRTWVFTKTILLNLLRDEYRRRAARPSDLHEVPDLPASANIEASGLARLELARVRRALNELSDAHRSVLLAEVGEEFLDRSESDAARKMMRMRARKKLSAAVEKISAVVVLRSKRTWEIIHGLVAIRDEAVPALGCILCIVLGAGSAVSVSLPSPAEAGVIDETPVTVEAQRFSTAGIVDRSDWSTDLPSQGEHITASAVSTASATKADSAKKKQKPTVEEEHAAEGELVEVPDHIPGTGVYVSPSQVGVKVDPTGGNDGEDPGEQVPGTSTIESLPVVNPSTIVEEEVSTIL